LIGNAILAALIFALIISAALCGHWETVRFGLVSAPYVALLVYNVYLEWRQRCVRKSTVPGGCMTSHTITVNGQRYHFELHSYPSGSLMQVHAPGVAVFTVESLDEARDALRSVYAQQDREAGHSHIDAPRQLG
jgi:hypothetical protein